MGRGGGGLGVVAVAYIGVDYVRHLSPSWHSEVIQPLLWVVLAIIAVARVPFYKHWSAELRSSLVFILSLLFMLSTLLYEMISVRSVTAVLGLTWHRTTPPLPDTGQWILLGLNEKLPQVIVNILRARIVGLHHYLMLFVMLAFSVLFGSIEAPGLGIGARYMFTMAIGRFLRALSFASTILPSPRPWCAASRFDVPQHPHPWAQKFYVPYASDSYAIRTVIHQDMVYDHVMVQDDEYRPNWGFMSFLADFLRPLPPGESAWINLLKKAGGGCNDLLYSGHMLVAVLTAMAWTEAYGGWSSGFIWMLVLHSAQREVRERHHYTVDCIVAIYVGFMLWKMTGFLWPLKNTSLEARLNKLEKIEGKLYQAAKDSDMDQVRDLLKQVGDSSNLKKNQGGRDKAMQLFAGGTIIFALTVVVLAFVLTSDGYGLVKEIDSDTIMYDTVFTAIGKSKQISHLLDLYHNSDCKPDIVSYICLIYCLGKNGDVDEAHMRFIEMEEKGLNPDVVTYSSLIECFGKSNKRCGRTAEAVDLYVKLKEQGLTPDSITCSFLERLQSGSHRKFRTHRQNPITGWVVSPLR
ncbi:sphingomyelin synthetase family protein isoform 1 [Tanacetum coccineum]